MYKFIFAWMYYYQKRGGSPSYKITASLLVGISSLVHFLIFVKFAEIFLETKLVPHFSDDYTYNRWSYAVFLIPYTLFIVFYYNKKRTESILAIYPEDINLYSFKNFGTFLLITIVPLIFLMWLTNTFPVK